MPMTTGSQFSGEDILTASKRLRPLANRMSALEHPDRSIAASAHVSKCDGFRSVRINSGKGEGHVEHGNLSSRSRGFNSLPVKASQPAGSESCMGSGNIPHEA